MPSPAEIREAERECRRQRHAAAKLLQVDETRATDQDRELAEKLRQAGVRGPAEFDLALADLSINARFQRGIFYFGEPT